MLPVQVEAPDLCGRFSGRIVRGVDTDARRRRPGWSSGWRAAASAAVTALVDISNYVMFEFGRPSHIFDLDKIHGGLTVRWGRPGETLELLNGNTVELDAKVGVIADDSRVESLAGIMGGDAHRGLGRHAQRLRRGGVLVARGGRRALAPLQLLDRRRPPLRARRRPGDDGRAHRAHHAADRRDLRRRETRCGPIDDHVVSAADARRR